MNDFLVLILGLIVLYGIDQLFFHIERVVSCKKNKKNCMKCKNWECSYGNCVGDLYKRGKYILSEEEKNYLIGRK